MMALRVQAKGLLPSGDNPATVKLSANLCAGQPALSRMGVCAVECSEGPA